MNYIDGLVTAVPAANKDLILGSDPQGAMFALVGKRGQQGAGA